MTSSKALRVLLIGRDFEETRAICKLLVAEEIAAPPFTEVALLRACSLERALAGLAESRPHVIVTDLNLPDSSGLATFRRLREQARETPILVLSEYEDDPLGYEAVLLGAQDCLVEGKLDALALSRSIRHALARFAYDDANRRSHDEYHETLTESDLPSLVVASDGRVLFSNSAACALLGNVPQRIDWSAGADRKPKIEFDSAPPLTPAARITDTLWEGRLATLITLEQGRGADPGASVAGGQPVSLFEGLATASPRMRTLFRTCERVAPTPATVLIQGETGTGKELVARAIHKRSGRTGRFVALDCGAVQESLLESELFGHERGAFTGASARKLGLFRHAHQGTLLLDEIGNMPLTSQHSLLRVLQERTVRPVGSVEEFAVDVRVIAASSSSLLEAVEAGGFREDLLYRLDVIRLALLPLRERPEDVLHLLNLFLEQLCVRYDLERPALGPGFLQAAAAYPWPGNVRQLENLSERVLLAGSACLSKRDFRDVVGASSSDSGGGAGPGVGSRQSLRAFMEQQEATYLESVLRRTRGSLPATAHIADLDPRTLRRKLKRHAIDRTRFLH